MIQPATLVLVFVAIVSANAFTADQIAFQNQCLAYHNQLRAKHCVPPLVLDNGLNQVAQNYSQYLASNNLFQHSYNQYGENLYSMDSSVTIKAVPITGPLGSWYGEKAAYNFNEPGFSEATGHFTQLVWKGSKKLGCGIAFANKNTTAIIVANYDPPGNFDGEYGDHVLAPTC